MNPLMNDTAWRNAIFLIFLLVGAAAPAYAEQVASSPPQSRDLHEKLARSVFEEA